MSKKIINMINYELKDRLWQFVIPVIFMVLANVLMSMSLYDIKNMGIEDNGYNVYGYAGYAYFGAVSVLFSIIGAVYGLSNYRYVFNKNEFMFYSLLPIKKLKYFFIRYFVSIFYVALVLILNTIYILPNELWMLALGEDVFLNAILTFILFIVAYNVGIFFSMISSSRIVQFLCFMSGFFALETFKLGFEFTKSEFILNAINKLLDYSLNKRLPILYVYSLGKIGKPEYEYGDLLLIDFSKSLIIIIFYSILFMVVSAYLYYKFKVENSNKIVINNNIVQFLKYFGQISIISVMLNGLLTEINDMHIVIINIVCILLIHIFSEFFINGNFKSAITNYKSILITTFISIVVVFICR